MTIYYLYIKTHKITGLKYLGQTSKQDPHMYLGSGIDWKIHLKNHGKDHTTEIIRECLSKQELTKCGRYYSTLWNIVESKEWANRIPETGGGTNHTPERKELFRKQQLGKKKPPRSDEHRKNLGDALRGISNPKTAEGLRTWYSTNPDRSDAIKKQANSLKKWYDANPELSTIKAIKTWDTRYKNQYVEYKRAIELISLGYGGKTILKKTGMNLTQKSIEKLRSGEHRIYMLFPDLNTILVV
jgi:hypothetical protein